MHATIPVLPHGIHLLLTSGFQLSEADNKLTDLMNLAEGKLLANGMAMLIEMSFGFLTSEGLTDSKAKKAQQFFEENFVIKDPNAEGGKRYYQGKILIRTRRPKDNMNVIIKFCSKPDEIYHHTPIGPRLNPSAIIDTQVLTELRLN